MSPKRSAPRIYGSPSASRSRLFRVRHGVRELLLGAGTLVVGRKSSCDYVVNDNQVSREHARFIVGGSSIAIEDLGSANGVLVNGQSISGLHRLEVGDRISIGSQTFEMLDGQDGADEEDEDADMTVISAKTKYSQPPESEDFEDTPTKIVEKR